PELAALLGMVRGGSAYPILVTGTFIKRDGYFELGRVVHGCCVRLSRALLAVTRSGSVNAFSAIEQAEAIPIPDKNRAIKKERSCSQSVFTPCMLVRQLAVASVLLYGSTNALWVRDVNGNWVRPSWEKRANQGDVLKLPLTNKGNKSYSTPVKMGTPFQEVQMAVSLSQNYICVASSQQQGASGFYNPTASSSYSAGSSSVAFTNTAGTAVQASFASETCDVAEFTYNASVAITAPAVTDTLYPDGCHGILGYGVDPKPDVPTNSTLLEAVCGIELNRDEPGLQGGTFTMGGKDETAFTGEFTVLNVPGADAAPNRPSWTVPLDDISARVSETSDNSTSFLQDPYLAIPGTAASNLYAQVEGATEVPATTASTGLSTGNRRYTVPCGSKVTLTLTFGGKSFPMDIQDFISKEGDVTFGAIFDDQGAPTFNVAFADKATRTATTGSGTPTGSASATATVSNGSTGNAFMNAPTTSLVSLLLGEDQATLRDASSFKRGECPMAKAALDRYTLGNIVGWIRVFVNVDLGWNGGCMVAARVEARVKRLYSITSCKITGGGSKID
ncbi:13224_t:CDS:10, partial [Acaulospora colombiana]